MKRRIFSLWCTAVVPAVILLGFATLAEAQLQPRVDRPQVQRVPGAVAPGPDLVVTEIRTGRRLFLGDCNTIRVTVRNQGNMPVLREQSFAVRLWIDIASELQGPLEDIVVEGGLATGASRMVTFRGYEALSTGFRGIFAEVDALKQIPESNESNNILAVADHVVARAIACPVPRNLRPLP